MVSLSLKKLTSAEQAAIAEDGHLYNLASKGIGVSVLAGLVGHRSIAVKQVYIAILMIM
jgi:hypothetical protein